MKQFLIILNRGEGFYLYSPYPFGEKKCKSVEKLLHKNISKGLGVISYKVVEL